jgi:hypothetical protein
MNLLELFEKIEENSITPNQYYLLWSIKNKRKPKGINGDLELRGLIADGFVKDGKLTEIANILVTDQIAPTGTVIDDIDKYLSVFPKGKLPSGKPARVNRRNIEEAFKWFFKNYKYEWSTIIAATVYYVDSFEKDNFKFMRNSQYFIRKQNSDKSWDSELATCCDIILNGDDQDDAPHFSERVV